MYIANLMLPDYPPPNPLWGKYDKAVGPDGPGQHIVVVGPDMCQTPQYLPLASRVYPNCPPEAPPSSAKPPRPALGGGGPPQTPWALDISWVLTRMHLYMSGRAWWWRA